MYLEKLTTLLKAFDKPRLNRLKAFVNSPYFKVPPVCNALLLRIAPLHPHFSEEEFTPSYIAKKEPTLSTVGKQANAASLLMRTIDSFIAEEEWQKSKTQMARYRLQGLKELQLPTQFEKEWKKQLYNVSNCPEQNVDTFFERHALAELSLNGFNAKLNRTAQNDMKPIIKTLDEFYALKKLRYLCEALNRQQVLGVMYHDLHISTLLKILEPYNNMAHPYVYLFVNVYHMMQETTYTESNLYYRFLKQFIQNSSKAAPLSAATEAAEYALNSCLRWFNKGYEEAGTEYLWWIEWKINNKLLLQNGKLMPVTFRNVVRIAALSKKKPEWIKHWVSTYASHLPAEHYETNHAFAMGLYEYTNQNYLQAIRFFLQAQVKEEVLFNSSVRIWQWMCLYEHDRGDTDSLLNQLHSFEKYLLRNKYGMHQRLKVFEWFIHYATKLIKETKSEALYFHLEKLQTHEHFPGKPWLMQQLAAKNKKPVRQAYG